MLTNVQMFFDILVDIQINKKNPCVLLSDTINFDYSEHRQRWQRAIIRARDMRRANSATLSAPARWVPAGGRVAPCARSAAPIDTAMERHAYF